jgi:Ca-activated chloride channel family protein
VLATDCARLIAAGVSTSAHGLGQSFNEDLLGAMADAGGGQGHDGETTEDLMGRLREAFDFLSAMSGRKVRLKFEPDRGVSVKGLNTYRTDADKRTTMLDLAYGAVAWALLRVRVLAALQAAAAGGLVHVMTALIDYEDGEGCQKSSTLVHLCFPRVPQATFEVLAEDAIVASRARKIRSSELLIQAREAANRHDLEAVCSPAGKIDPHCRSQNVIEDCPPIGVAASANWIAGADGGWDQLGCAARGRSSGGTRVAGDDAGGVHRRL